MEGNDLTEEQRNALARFQVELFRKFFSINYLVFSLIFEGIY